jgi:polyisoprenoid-binding protein YceI
MNTAQKLLLPLALTVAIAACKPATPPAPPAGGPAPAEGAAPPPPPPGGPAPGAAPGPAVEPIKAVSGTYKLDPGHTDVLVQWTHFGYSHPSAHFGNVDGTLVYDADDVSKSSVAVTLPLSGLNSFAEGFNDHLKADKFFDAAKFPNATFKSTKVEAVGPNKLAVTGDLTIKDITKPVTLEVILNGAGEHPMKKVQAIGFDAVTHLKRSDFGVGAFAPNVSDEVTVRITTEATQAPAAP